MTPSVPSLYVPIPGWLSACFAGLVLFLLIGLYFLFRRVAGARTFAIMLGCLAWLSILHFLAEKSFFLQLKAVPPRFLVAVVPPFLLLLGVFLSPGGRRFVDRLSLPGLTWLHTVRVGVELLLFALFLSGQIPKTMTFEGYNWDILAGLTAPVMVWMVFYQPRWSPKLLLWWNFVALGLLINIVATAILSSPLSFQQFNIEQPNVGVLKPVFIWLPGFVVPVVLFAHLAAIRQLWR